MLDVYIVFTLVLLFFWFVRGCRKPDRFPPGPSQQLQGCQTIFITFLGDCYLV